MDAILGEVTIRRRRKKLEEMTQGNGVGEAYTATLFRLKAQKGYKLLKFHSISYLYFMITVVYFYT